MTVRYRFSAVRIVALTVLMVLAHAALAQGAAGALTYTTVEQWNIDAGGLVRIVVVNQKTPTEAQLRALGEKLKEDTKNEPNAAVHVYDDAGAARNRHAAWKGTLSAAKTKVHDRHRVALYWRDAVRGTHTLDISTEGVDGPVVVVKY